MLLRKNLAVLLCISALVPVACARKRPIERKMDIDGDRFAKADFETSPAWLGKVTIVNNGSNSAFGFVGAQSDVKIGSFRFTKDHLQFVAIDESSKAKEPRILNEWYVQHSDYHQRISGGRVSNVETENDTISWKEKRYFHVNWESAAVSESTSFPFEVDAYCWSKKLSRLVDGSQEVDAEHINFTIAVDYEINPACLTDKTLQHDQLTHTIEYKYSFMPDRASDYKPYVYTGETDPLMRKFGYFTTVNPYVNAEGRAANSFYMNRWDANKTHTIYFAPNFPNQYKWIYNDPEQGVIARTNKLFAENGLSLRFEIKDSDGSQKFGDIRYSFVNIIEDSDEQAPLGYGPVDAHPRSGEILSSNTTMWVSELKFYLQHIKEQGERAQVRDTASSLYREINSLMGSESSAWTSSSNFLDVPEQAAAYRYLLPEFTYGNQGSAFANRGVNNEVLSADKRLMNHRAQKNKNFPELTAALENGNAQVESMLKRSDRDVQRLSTVWHLDDGMFAGLEGTLPGQDAQKVIDDILYRVAIHEFGHNLNLRHNFYGSVDAGSRRGQAEATTTTSVMDYMDLKDEIGSAHDWEAYDKAALLYAYSDGKIDKVKESGDPFLFCTDEHLRANPLCNQFDSGSSPTEILKSMIEQYDDTYWMRNFRYGRDFWNTSGYASRAFSTMWEVKKFLSFQQSAFRRSDIRKGLMGRKSKDPMLTDAFSNSIQDDMQQAVRLAVSFYAAVIKQKTNDRPFNDAYDPFSGGLTRQGIFYDKIFASRFLMGDDAFSMNPNEGNHVVSFLPMIKGDAALGPLLKRVMADVYVNAGDMFAGYDDMGREYFIQSAAGILNREYAPTDYARISCFRKASFEAAFQVASAPLEASTYDLEPSFAAEPYFTGEAVIEVMPIDGVYYVAGANKNPYAASLLKTGDVNGILNSYRSFYELTTGRVPECQ